jgi:hypothetical protein
MIEPVSPPGHRIARDRERRIGVHAVLAQMLTDRHARDAQRIAHAVVRLHQYANGVCSLAVVRRDTARCGADAALELVADHAGAATHVALRDRAAGRVVERLGDVLGPDVEAVDVV